MNWSNVKHYDIFTDFITSQDTVKAVAERHEISPKTASKIIAFGIKHRPKKIVVKAAGTKRLQSVHPFGLLAQPG